MLYMQGKTIEIDAAAAQERLANAISRLEKAVVAYEKKRVFEEQVRHQVIKELDLYITNLGNLLNSNKK